MKKFITGLFLLMGLHGWGQVDSLEFTTRRQVADTVFGLLNESIYGPALIEKSITEDAFLINQIHGNYSDISNGWSWLQAYSDIALSYSDSTYMYSDTALLHHFENFHLDMRDTSGLDLLKQPFGLLLHHVSRIDTTFLNTPGVFSNDHCQLRLDENIDESSIYQKVILKSAALLELDGEHGYDQGIIYYHKEFISTSPDIMINSIQLNMGTGFLPFSATNARIEYTIQKDFQIGRAAIEYTLNESTRYDTLSFYVSTKTYQYKNNEKSASNWDSPIRYFPQKKGADLEYCILYGCGNPEEKIRRPVIFAPPYRPISQFMLSFNKYYDQFNFKSLLTSLSEMGYDVIFIKETPGNRGIDHAGGILGDFIKFINEKKKEHFPNEDWENVVIGFSAGGQHWRYALKKLEKEHMDQNLPHHHTRLYIPFDSPHWGANVPMFTQAVYRDMYSFSIPALLSYESLTDAASKDMLMNHIIGSNLTEDDHVYTITPAPATEKLNLTNKLHNWFNHQFTPMNDLRKSFPTFTRNVAISTGNNDENYNSEFGLYPGMKLFSQNVFAPAWYGGKAFNRSIYSSQSGTASQVFKREDLYLFLGIPLWFKRFYKTNHAYEWDLAQGGYKDEFYDEGAMNWNAAPLSGVPVGAINILVASAQNIILPFGPAWGTQHYKGHVSFLPMVSALGINPSIWQNNNLYYNLKDEGLMYNEFNSNTQSDLYGYPNLAHPTNHFNITPFEAVYCDPQTYEHIKMQESVEVEEDDLEDVYLVHTRNFILDEVEADIVYLQNKIIGKNHNQWYGTYRYKAWYKAYQDIVVGTNVTPKTDPGPYTIESTGEITMYACREINLKPGFSSANGSSFHGFIHCDGCYRPHGKSEVTTSGSNSETGQQEEQPDLSQRTLSESEEGEELKVFPNPTTDQFTIVFPESAGKYVISDVNGRIFETRQVGEENKTRYLTLPKGVYYLKWVDGSKVVTKKIMVL